MRKTFHAAVLFLISIIFYTCSQSPPVVPENSRDNESVVMSKVSYPSADYFIVEYTAGDNEFASSVKGLGGVVQNIFPAIKVAQVSGLTDETAAKLEKTKGVKSAARDMMVQWVKPDRDIFEQSIGSDETFWPYQWAPRAISAPDAWDAGYTGNGVRVAVIDGGISSNHIDLRDNIDFSASKSFVPGYNFDEDDPGFRHATHVAGIIAAEDNGIGTIGIAPHATIIALKALQGGSGSFAWIISAIMYAADQAGADIINMSLGAVFSRNSNDAAKLNSALGLAMNYAYQRGVTIVVAAGNDAIDFDHAQMWVSMPAEAQHVICVSATGPSGYYYGSTNFDKPASYTNYGQSLVDFAAPGGDDVLYPTTGWQYDMILSPSYVSGGSNYYSFADGTSMASPHVAGVAALIMEKYGRISPAQVAAKLRSSSDDLGKPGNDDYYGLGRVNAFRAVSE